VWRIFSVSSSASWYDDLAKLPGLAVAGLAEYRADLTEAVAASGSTSS
jgi:hypothetical protein